MPEGKTKENGERKSVLADLKERQARISGRGNLAGKQEEYKRKGMEL